MLWFLGVAFFLFIVASAVGAWVYFDGPRKARNEAERMPTDQSFTPGQRWDELSAYSGKFKTDWRGIDYLQDEDVKRISETP